MAAFCEAHNKGLTAEIPVKALKKKRRIDQRTVLILRLGNRIAVRKRTEEALLQNLWEYPNYEGHWTDEQCKVELEALHCRWSSVVPIGQAKHLFTHIEWHMYGIQVTLSEKPDQTDWVWATPEELNRQYAIPTAFRAFTPSD